MFKFNHQVIRKIFISVLIFTNFVIVTSCCADDELYVIRNVHSSGLVLDATDDSQIKIRHFTGFSTQLWQFKRANGAGIFYLVSNYTGKVLDVKEKQLLLNMKEDVESQRWSISLAGQISNIGKPGKVVDVLGGNFTDGNIVQLWPENKTISQKFVFIKKV